MKEERRAAARMGRVFIGISANTVQNVGRAVDLRRLAP
jgi:hypothetical protein